MKRIITLLFIPALITMLVEGCKKNSENVGPQTTSSTGPNLHGMGLNPMQPGEWANVPVFSADLFKNKLQTNGLSYSGTAYSSYLLVSPQVRDQGQIGSCTGFCGAETDEILYYYKNAVSPITNFTTAAGAYEATMHQIANTSEESYYGATNSSSAAFSPLFLYFVERVVINNGSISTDPGANMVNIGEALQGRSNNGGSGGYLIYNSYTFDGISPEPDYTYPFVLGSGGYNVATSSDSPYKTYPYDYHNYGSSTIPVSPYNYPIGQQAGSTTNSGSTSAGYYVINDTKTALVNDVKTALLNNKPVMMGFNVYDKSPSYPYFENLSTTKYTYNPLSSSGNLVSGIKLMGGHAVPIIGYIDDAAQPGGGVFICENSWGTPWGYHGYFYLPYSVIQNTKVVPSGSLYVAIL